MNCAGDCINGIAAYAHWHCCKVRDAVAFCITERPYISNTLFTRHISPRG
ncbi:hypothetical protein B5I52_004791 [Salmonella enterica subsp. enterica serovar Berkeley]|nr:hypothetical protein [Salmonella enterica subsp. enterica serovar Berkeley]EED7442339.1 hypothetical protein [Salmonella enterica subsp. salamae]EEJ7566497.1 hypothetical protein [Salmonella enterica subsp. salamae]